MSSNSKQELKKSSSGVPSRHFPLTKTPLLTGLAASHKHEDLGHCRLTDSPARTNVTLFLHRAVRLIILRVVNLAPVRKCEAHSSALRGPRLRAQTWRHLLVTPCASGFYEYLA
jgi:hypothetical protein